MIKKFDKTAPFQIPDDDSLWALSRCVSSLIDTVNELVEAVNIQSAASLDELKNTQKSIISRVHATEAENIALREELAAIRKEYGITQAGKFPAGSLKSWVEDR